MIRPLRQLHRVAWVFLAITLPVLLVASLRARRAPAFAAKLAGAAVGAPDTAIARATGCLGEQPVRLELFARSNGARFHFYALTADGELVAPAVLVYLDSGANPSTPAAGSGSSDRVPDGARLLGPLSSDHRLEFRPDDDSGAGDLMLYSLAHSRLVGSISLTDPPRLEDCG